MTVSSLLAAAMLTGSGAQPVTAVAGPDLFTIELRGTARARAARGMGKLEPVSSPFGVSVTPDGRATLELEVTAERLLPPARLGKRHYVAWVADPDLSEFQRLGPLEDGAARGTVEMNKFIVLVTAEDVADGDAPTGPVVLRGISPSGSIRSLASHELFSNDMPCE